MTKQARIRVPRTSRARTASVGSGAKRAGKSKGISTELDFSKQAAKYFRYDAEEKDEDHAVWTVYVRKAACDWDDDAPPKRVKVTVEVL